LRGIDRHPPVVTVDDAAKGSKLRAVVPAGCAPTGLAIEVRSLLLRSAAWV